MKKHLSLICIVSLLIGCGTTSKLNIISPSLPEDEIKEQASKSLSHKTQPTARDNRASQEKTPLKESIPSEESLSSDHITEALINLLEKKGVMTKKELSEEIKRLKQGSK